MKNTSRTRVALGKLCTLMALAVFSSSSYGAQDSKDPFISKLDSICVPALKTLAEPTTPANLTPLAELDDGGDNGAMFERDPDPDPLPPPVTTMGVVTYLLRAIALEVGNRIFEQYFKKIKSGLVEEDFKRIAQIVADALREDAKRKTENCLVAIQAAHRKISGDKFIASRAVRLDETTSAILIGIDNFDHDYTRMALMGGGIAAATMQLGLVQEMGKRMTEINKSYFEMTKSDSVQFINAYAKQMTKKYLDETNPEVYRTKFETREVNDHDELKYNYWGHLWGKLEFFRTGWCEGPKPKNARRKAKSRRARKGDSQDQTYTCARLKSSYEQQTYNLFAPKEQQLKATIHYKLNDKDWDVYQVAKAIEEMPFSQEEGAD